MDYKYFLSAEDDERYYRVEVTVEEYQKLVPIGQQCLYWWQKLTSGEATVDDLPDTVDRDWLTNSVTLRAQLLASDRAISMSKPKNKQ